MKVVRQQPFDPIASPEDTSPLDISVLQISNEVACAPQISGANWQRAHLFEPTRQIGVLLRGELHLHRFGACQVGKERYVGDGQRSANEFLVGEVPFERLVDEPEVGTGRLKQSR